MEVLPTRFSTQADLALHTNEQRELANRGEVLK